MTWIIAPGDKDGYAVKCKEYEGTSENHVVVGKNAVGATCSGLIPGKQYGVTVTTFKTGWANQTTNELRSDDTKTSKVYIFSERCITVAYHQG